jgi:hypothetical protein
MSSRPGFRYGWNRLNGLWAHFFNDRTLRMGAVEIVVLQGDSRFAGYTPTDVTLLPGARAKGGV